VIAPWRGGGVDGFPVQKAADHDPASGLACFGVRPAQLIRDAFAIRAESDVVDPAVTVKIVRAKRWGHGVT
jgi:hypothetical protein